MNSTSTTVSPLMAGAAKLARELVERKAAANADVGRPLMPSDRVAPNTLDVSRVKQFFCGSI